MSFTIKYILFAIIATAVNLLFQFISFKVYKGCFSLYIGMCSGTAAGWLVKYVLDKKYIFFWAFEMVFYFSFKGYIFKYIGAIFGLIIGYAIKYFLDKRFVFGGKN